jgi:hypothetical protein
MQDLCAVEALFNKSMHSGIYAKMVLAGFLHWLQSTGNVLLGAVIGFLTGYVSDILKTGRSEKRKRERMRRALYVEIAQLYALFKSSREGLLATLKSMSEFEANFEAAKQRLSEKMLTQEKLSAELNKFDDVSEKASEMKNRLEQISNETSNMKEQISKIQSQFETAASMKPKLAHIYKLVGTDSYRYAKSNPEIYYDLTDAWAIDGIYLHVNLILGSVEADDIKDTARTVQSFVEALTGAITSGSLDRTLLKRVAGVMFKDMEKEIADQINKAKSTGADTKKDS